MSMTLTIGREEGVLAGDEGALGRVLAARRLVGKANDAMRSVEVARDAVRAASGSLYSRMGGMPAADALADAARAVEGLPSYQASEMLARQDEWDAAASTLAAAARSAQESLAGAASALRSRADADVDADLVVNGFDGTAADGVLGVVDDAGSALGDLAGACALVSEGAR